MACNSAQRNFSIAGKQICIPFDLNHAFGNHVLVNQEWSQKDRETFRDNGQPFLDAILGA